MRLAIHGNKSQGARTKALADFKSGELQVLVATDIAARGIDIDQLPHVVNFELPNVPEDYVHRIGRTGRAGASGEAISLVCVDEEGFLADIEKPDQASASRASRGAGLRARSQRAVAQPIQVGRRTLGGGGGGGRGQGRPGAGSGSRSGAPTGAPRSAAPGGAPRGNGARSGHGGGRSGGGNGGGYRSGR